MKAAKSLACGASIQCCMPISSVVKTLSKSNGSFHEGFRGASATARLPSTIQLCSTHLPQASANQESPLFASKCFCCLGFPRHANLQPSQTNNSSVKPLWATSRTKRFVLKQHGLQSEAGPEHPKPGSGRTSNENFAGKNAQQRKVRHVV